MHPGYFNTEQQKWWTFLGSIEQGAREIIPETIRPQAIAEIIAIFETTENEDTRRRAALSLGQIDPGNPQAIADLVRILETTKNG